VWDEAQSRQVARLSPVFGWLHGQWLHDHHQTVLRALRDDLLDAVTLPHEAEEAQDRCHRHQRHSHSHSHSDGHHHPHVSRRQQAMAAATLAGSHVGASYSERLHVALQLQATVVRIVRRLRVHRLLQTPPPQGPQGQQSQGQQAQRWLSDAACLFRAYGTTLLAMGDDGAVDDNNAAAATVVVVVDERDRLPMVDGAPRTMLCLPRDLDRFLATTLTVSEEPLPPVTLLPTVATAAAAAACDASSPSRRPSVVRSAATATDPQPQPQQRRPSQLPLPLQRPSSSFTAVSPSKVATAVSSSSSPLSPGVAGVSRAPAMPALAPHVYLSGDEKRAWLLRHSPFNTAATATATAATATSTATSTATGSGGSGSGGASVAAVSPTTKTKPSGPVTTTVTRGGGPTSLATGSRSGGR
jgi:hypothetical protein